MANMNIGLNIVPKIDNLYTLGNANYKWQIFADSINGVSASAALLPAITSSNNGQILKVVNGVWAVGDAPSGIPTVSVSDNNKILQVSNGEWTAVTGLMTGATSSANGTSGLVPAPTTSDVNKFLAGDGTYKSGGLPMVILKYGISTWTDFINAYNNNVIVYCRASSSSNPASGSQLRMAFMAYVNNDTNPTEVEFQYYRSVSSHTASQMGDQVFVYKLNKTNGWSVTTREASLKQISVGSGLSVSYSSNKITINLE